MSSKPTNGVNGAKRLKAMMENYLEARRDGPKYGYEIRLVEPDNYEYYYILVKPLAGVYKGQKYMMEMKTTYGRDADQTTYPTNAPYIHFITNIFHVNISANGGSICLDILKDKDKWSPLNSFDTLIQNILLLFNEPNNGSPYNGEASRLWVECEKQYKTAKRPGMTVQAADDLYMQCFEPFITEANRVMKTSNYKQYASWFPELDQKSPEYTARVESNETELADLEGIFAQMKLAKKKVSTPEPPKKEDLSAADGAKLDVNKDSGAGLGAESSVQPVVANTKKNRWAKYQTKEP